METKDLNIENQKIWESNAECWDQFMGDDGNNWHKELVAPKTVHLLNLQRGNRLLDIGCGNGLFARRMALQGIKVTAFDFSRSNIEHAQKYDCSNIDYRIIDATSTSDLSTLHTHKYDGIVANMVLMDMPDIESLFSHIKELLTDNGRFVFSIQHPCFNSEYVEEGPNNSLQLTNYIQSSTSKGTAIPTQIKRQYYFHRPVSYYMNLGIKNGLTINGYEEPTFNEDSENGVFSKFPPILIVSMKK